MPQKTIVIIDDDPEIRVFLFNLLQSEGYRPVTFENPHEALGSLHRIRPDLIILDYKMPQVSGIDLLPDLRVTAPHTPVLMLTAHGDPDLYMEAFDKGACDMLTKPIRVESLIRNVRRILEDELRRPTSAIAAEN